MNVGKSGDWMTVADLIQETGLSKSAAYNAVSKGLLPVPVYKFGGTYAVSRQAWEEMKARQLNVTDTEGHSEGTEPPAMSALIN